MLTKAFQLSIPARKFALPSFLFLGFNYILWLVMAYVPIYLTDMGFSHVKVGVLIAAFPLTSLLLTIPFGIFSDRLPPRRLVTASMVIFGLFFFGLRYLEGFWFLVPLFVLGGIASALFRISNPALYLKSLGENRKGIKLGFFNGIGLLGYGLGPLSGGYLLETSPMTALFEVALLLVLPFLLLTFLLEDIEPIQFQLGEYKRDIARKEVLILATLSFVMGVHLGTEQTSLSLFLDHNIKLEWLSIGWIFFFIGLGISTMSIVDGFVQDVVVGKNKGLAGFLYGGLFISGLFNMNMLFAHDFGSVLAIRLFHVLGDSLFLVSLYTIIANLFLSGRVGGNLGVIQTSVTLGIFSGALISGALPGYLYPFVFAGVLAILSIPLAAMTKPKF